MVKLKSVVLAVLLLVVIGYLGTKIYVYYRVRDSLEALVAAARPFATVRYDGISSSLNGSVGVEGLEIRPQTATLPVRIGSAEVKGPGFGFLWNLVSGRGRDQLPEWLELSVDRMELPHILDLYPAMESVMRGLDPVGAKSNPDPCTLVGLLGDAGMYPKERFPLRLNLRLGYRVGAQGGPAQVYASYGTNGGESMMFDLGLSGLPEPQLAVQGKLPKVERYSLSYQAEAERISRPIAACATKAGITPEQFVTNLLAESDGQYGELFGVIPGPGLRQALRQFLLNPGEVRISGAPNLELSRHSSLPEDPKLLVSLLDPTLTVGGQPVRDLSFGYPQAPGGGERSVAADGAKGAAARGGPAPPRFQYVATPVEELGRYLQRDVKIHSPKHPRPVEGILVAVEGGEASIERRVPQGKLTVHLGLRDIQKAEVLRPLTETPVP